MVVFSLTLVRHGETTANKDGVIQGHQDVALSDVGVKQARLVAVRLQNDKFTHIFASDLSRAAQTAQAIVEASTACHCSVQLDKRLRERGFGSFEGKTFKDLLAAAQKSNKKWPDFTPDGAETFEEMRFRAQAFFRELCEMMAEVSLPVERTYIPTSLKEKRPTAGLNNGRTFAADTEAHEKLVLTEKKAGYSAVTVRYSSSSSSSPLSAEEAVASKRPRMEEPQLHRLSLEGVGPSPDADGVVGGEVQAAGAPTTTTMARSNSSSSSGCSSLHDSVECQEADLDLPTPTEEEEEEEERDINSADMGISRSKKYLSPFPSGSVKASMAGRWQSGSEERTLGSGVGLTPVNWPWDGSLHWFRDTDPSSVPGSLVAPSSLQSCPNVSLSPLLEHRLSSISTVSSGRNSSFDDADFVPSAAGEVLIVSHGGFIKELVTHFIEDLNCKVPGGKGHALRVCPNTGVSRFMVTLSDLDLQPTVTCLQIHDKDHLRALQQDPLHKPLLAV